MNSFYKSLIEAREKSRNKPFLSLLEYILYDQEEKLKKSIFLLKDILHIQAKSTHSYRVSTHFEIDINNIFENTKEEESIDIRLPKKYRYPQCYVQLIHSTKGECFKNIEEHDLLVKYICEYVSEVSVLTHILKKEFDEKAKIHYSITNNKGETHCQFIITISYELDE